MIVNGITLNIGSVINVEVDKTSWVSRTISKLSGSKFTHAFPITGEDLAVESTFPRVKQFVVSKRLVEYQRKQRRWVVMDMDLPMGIRQRISEKARSYIGRWYAVPKLLWFMVTGRFSRVGTGMLFCSRLVTASYRAAGIDLYPREYLEKTLPWGYPRMEQIDDGWVTPGELGLSLLKVVEEARPHQRLPRQVRRRFSRRVAKDIEPAVEDALNG